MRTRWLALMLLAGAPVVFGQQEAEGPDSAPDEPGRAVARLSLLNGDASVRRGDSGDWVAANVNAPLMVDDSVSVSPGGHAEIQFDYSNMVRIAGDSEVKISDLEQSRYGIQVIKGLVTYRFLRDANTQAEISTPEVAVRPGRRSAVRVEVLPDGSSRITVRSGEVEVYTPSGVERVRAGSTMMVRGSASDPEYQIVQASNSDDWDRWNDRRDHDLEGARSYQYMSRDISGGEDLDANGRWDYDPAYGNVWAPRVDAGWAPYRVGRWAWEDYYGWTWVSEDPWGWAPYHYGSWYNRAGFGWCWYPGSIYSRHFWRPGLVAFVGFGGGWHGGAGFGLGVGGGWGGIGWVPLAPFERYRPWYGRGWYGGNRTTVVNNVNIVNNTNISNIYRNARVDGGVTGVNGAAFRNGNFRQNAGIPRQQLQQASLVRGALPVSPGREHLQFSDRPVSASTPRVNPGGNQHFYSRMSSAGEARGQNVRTPFAQQQAAFSGISGSSVASARAAERAGANPGLGQSSPRSFSQPQANGYGNGAGQGAGWRRFGGAADGNNPAINRGTERGAQGFGRSGNQSVVGSPSGSASGNPGTNWRSFGTPGGVNSPAQQSAPSVRGGSNDGWNRFGRPQAETPSGSGFRNSQQSQPGAGYQQRGFRGDTGRGETGNGYHYSNSAPGSSRPLQISPPIVHQRESPSYGGSNFGGGGGGRNYGGQAPSYRGPAPSYGGGGGFSRPSSGGGGNFGRPSGGGFSRPSGGGGSSRPSGGGGGGGHVSSGGGHGGGRR